MPSLSRQPGGAAWALYASLQGCQPGLQDCQQSSDCVLYGLPTKRLLTGTALRPCRRLADPAPVAQTFFVDDELKACAVGWLVGWSERTSAAVTHTSTAFLIRLLAVLTQAPLCSVRLQERVRLDAIVTGALPRASAASCLCMTPAHHHMCLHAHRHSCAALLQWWMPPTFCSTWMTPRSRRAQRTRYVPRGAGWFTTECCRGIVLCTSAALPLPICWPLHTSQLERMPCPSFLAGAGC